MSASHSKEPNFYSVLNVPASVLGDDLRAAYLKLALKYHPDRNPGDKKAEDKFKAISQAYAILRDPQSRVKYDRLLAKRARKGPTPKHPAPPPRHGAPPTPKKPFARPHGYTSAGTYNPPPEAAARHSPPSPQASRSDRASREGAQRRERAQPPRPSTPPSVPSPTSSPAAKTSPIAAPGTAPSQDPEDILAGFFTTPEGEFSLKKLQEELQKSGLSTGPAVLDKIKNYGQKARAASKSRFSLKKIFRSLKDFFFFTPLAAPGPKVTEFDLVFGLALLPEAALKGSSVELQYFQDGHERKLAIRVPPGIQNNTRLRLAGQGNLKPNGARGDLIIAISIRPKENFFS
ncbi:MAG: DnaJ domain-containing protein [Deltaproteobacteria bacterium]|jgi:curved DNA-binding protein CbpA|nr:DnaJ domain-containing protein [Deltaproteobacteria bacterium]